MAPAQQVHDEHWLKQQLVKALHWDDDVAEGVLGLIVNATKPEEVQEVTAAYMDNNPVAVCAISDFLAARQGGKQQQQRQQQSQQQPKQQQPKPQQQQQQQSGAGASAASGSYSSSVSAAPQPAAKQPAATTKQQQQDKWLHLGGQPPAPADQGTSQAGDAGTQGSGKQQAEATLAMFKRGGRLTTKIAAAGAAGGGGGGGGGSSSRRKGEQLDSITSKLECKVANCLSCGKIFDCRNVTSDVMRFIDSGFKCTYCGATVAMTQQQRIQQAQQQQQQQQQQQEEQAAGSSPPLDAAAADAQARAIAFKDRLVEYDRHAQQRTTVIDDQSDFFEIETNAWLSEEERVELRRRAQLEEEAAAARRNKVTVTLDLLGRKVVVADGPEVPQPGGTGAAGSSGSSFELGGTSATQQLLQQVQAAVSKEHKGEGGSGKQGSSSTAAPGGKDAEETLAEALAAISNLRISAHPNLTTTPVFVPKRKQQQQQQEPAAAGKAGQPDGKQTKHGKQQKGKQTQKPQAGAQKAGQQAVKQPRKQLSAVAARAAAADSRVQDDSIFGDFEAELLCDELLRKQPAQVTQAVQ